MLVGLLRRAVPRAWRSAGKASVLWRPARAAASQASADGGRRRADPHRDARLAALALLLPLCLPPAGPSRAEGRPAPPPEQVPSFAADDDAKRRRRELVAGAGPVVQLLLGDAIGDAFGFPIEMQDAYWIRSFVKFPPTEWPMRHVIPDWWDMKMLGMYSDDAEMTVGLMKGLMRYGRRIAAEGMLTAWRQEWDLSACRPPPADAGVKTKDGATKRSGHGGIFRIWEGQTTLEKQREFVSTQEFPGNAPPMRALPLAFLDDAAEREKLAILNADTTHPHPRARAASLLVAAAGHWLVAKRGDQREVLRVALAELRASGIRDAATEELLSTIDELPDYHEYGPRFRNMPQAVHCLLCGPQPMRTWPLPVRCGVGPDAMRTAGIVLYVLKWHQGPLDALAASVDVGGDVDSTAALILGVVGGSGGLRFGEPGGIPWFMVEQLEGVEYLVARAKEFEAWLAKEKLSVGR